MTERGRGRRPQRVLLPGLLLLVGLVAAGCSDDPSPAVVPPSATGSPTALWNPCDGLDAAAVGKILGGPVTKDDGEPSAPRCAFTPKREDGAALNANYRLVPEGLDAAWDTLGPVAGRQIDLVVPGADDARMVVKFAQDSLLITGFVQNGDLIQVVNLVQPAPFDRDVAVRAMRTVLADLSAHAKTGPTTA